MKKSMALVFAVALLTSCVSTSFYQVHTTQAEAGIEVKQGIMFYENDEIKVTYNFWDEGGDASFKFYNKTDSNIYLDLGNSHFIVNGYANTYFNNRTYASSTSGSASLENVYTRGSVINNQYYSSSVTSGSAATSSSKTILVNGFSVAIEEQRVVCIPPESAKIIRGFKINSSLIRNCDMYRFPKKEKHVSTTSYDESNSPVVFENIIAYGFSEDSFSDFKSVKNKFWVVKVSNYPSDQFTYYATPEYCDEKAFSSVKYFKYDASNNYYIHYFEEPATYKH